MRARHDSCMPEWDVRDTVTSEIPLSPDVRARVIPRPHHISHASGLRHHTHELRSAVHTRESRSALSIGAKLPVGATKGAPKKKYDPTLDPDYVPAPPKMARPRGGKGLPHPGNGQPIAAKAGGDEGPGTSRHTGIVSQDSQKTALKWMDMSTNPAASKPSRSSPVDDGGYEISDDVDAVCGGGGNVCGAEKKIAASWKKQGSWWTSGGTKQKPLSELEPDERAGLKAEGMDVGAQVVADMAHYDITPSQEGTALQTFRASEIEAPLQQTGFTEVKTDTEVKAVDISSKAKPKASSDSSLVTLLTSKALGFFAITSRLVGADGTAPGDRQYSSALTWSGWKAAAGALASKLRGVLNHNLVDQQMNNYIAVAHEDWSEEIIDVPFGRDGAPLSPIAGHGVWKRGHPAFTLLHAGSNLRSNAYMIAEENTNMDNPYLKEVHTFPRVVMGTDLKNNVPAEAVRETVIVFVYGPRPT